jgi:hypothetical protein
MRVLHGLNDFKLMFTGETLVFVGGHGFEVGSVLIAIDSTTA